MVAPAANKEEAGKAETQSGQTEIKLHCGRTFNLLHL